VMNEPTDDELKAAVQMLWECVARHLREGYVVELTASCHDSVITVKYCDTGDMDEAETLYYGEDWGVAVDTAMKHAEGST